MKLTTKTLIISSLLLSTLFISNHVAAHQVNNTTYSKFHIKAIQYDATESAYIAISSDDVGHTLTLPIEYIQSVSESCLNALQSEYVGEDAFVEYDDNGGSSNTEDWTVLNWHIPQEVD